MRGSQVITFNAIKIQGITKTKVHGIDSRLKKKKKIVTLSCWISFYRALKLVEIVWKYLFNRSKEI